ncbi:hypothetical protein KRM28CT15_03790 [Krasilnikovia sp. M28-CT-15]
MTVTIRLFGSGRRAVQVHAPTLARSPDVRFAGSSNACHGRSSSTRYTPSAARIATRHPFSSPASQAPAPAIAGCRTTFVQPSSRSSKCS